MSDSQPQQSPPRQTDRWLEPGQTNAQVIYILYLVVGVTMIVGVVLAYINRGKTGGFVESHYTFLIRTFWIGLLYGLISVVLFFVFIGVLLMFVVLVWFIARCVLGLQALQRGEAVKNPESWLLGG